MKTQKLSSWIMVAIMVIGGLSLSAQQMQGRNFQNFTNPQIRFAYLELSAAQLEQAKTFYTEMQKMNTPLRVDIQEKQAQLNKLMIADQPNEKDIYTKVEEIADLRLEIQKARIASRLQLRSILDANQKVLFDARGFGNRNGNGFSKGNGRGNGNRGGQGMGSGNRY